MLVFNFLLYFVIMSYSNKMKSAIGLRPYTEDVLRREIEKAIKDVHGYGSPIKKGKRYRSAFTTEQVKYLEKEFRKYPYIGNARRKDVANVLDIPERAVKIWFQNRRMKEKKDTPIKESDGHKSKENHKLLNSSTSSTNDDSLPFLQTSDSPVCIEVKVKEKKSKSAIINKYEDLSSQDTESESNEEYSIEVKNYSTLNTTPVSLVKNHLTENNNSMIEDKCFTKINHIKPTNHELYARDYHNVDYSPSPQTVPQDLSSKPVVQSQDTQQEQTFPEFPDMKINNDGLPFYLKGYYASPYLPPAQIIWKPVNVAPLIASKPIPALITGSGSILPDESTVKQNCTCDCHRTCSLPVMLPNNSNPNMQYILSAVPFPNSSSKC